MTSRERLLTALSRGRPDRVPATVHQWQPYHLNTYLGGISDIDAFRHFGLDAAVTIPNDCSEAAACHAWQVNVSTYEARSNRRGTMYTITTPGGTLTRRDEANEQTTWTVEPLLKRPDDLELLSAYLPVPVLDRTGVDQLKGRLGNDGILRGTLFGEQAGPWQHACCLYGTEQMILQTYDDPAWVHEFLELLTVKKLEFIERSLDGVPIDLIETGGGAGSSTVISPAIFKEFCLPYDRRLHDALHAVDHKVVYHTCGGMMPILDLIVENGCDAAETLSPRQIGGDADHAEMKQRIGKRVCLVGGLDQLNVLTDGTPRKIKAEVHRLFDTLGPGGGYILSTCDHFFDAPEENLRAFAAAARECTYGA